MSVRKVEITRERAEEIMRQHMNGPQQQVVIAYGGKWYDIRGYSPTDIEALITDLMGRPIKQEERAHIDIRI